MKKFIAEITAAAAALAMLTACGPDNGGQLVTEDIPSIDPIVTASDTSEAAVTTDVSTGMTSPTTVTTAESATVPTTASPDVTTAATTAKPETKPTTTKAPATEPTTAKATETEPEEEGEYIAEEEIPNLDEYLASLFGDDYDDGNAEVGG